MPDATVFAEFATQKLCCREVLGLLGSGRLACPPESNVRVAALALQLLQGDHLDASATRHHMDEKRLLADATIRHYGVSLEACARLVEAEYKLLKGMDEASAALGLLTLVQQLPSYGVALYPVQDAERDAPVLLGIGPTGASVYDVEDRTSPAASFPWLSVRNASVKRARFRLELLVLGGDGAVVPQERTFVAASPAVGAAIMAELVFQHAQSLRFEDQLRRRRREQLTALATAVAASSPRFPKNRPGVRAQARPIGSPRVAKRVIAPAREVQVPEAARGVADWVGGGGGGTPAVRIVAPAVEGSGAPRDVAESEALLDDLGHRRDQIIAELARKRRVLAQLQVQERELLGDPPDAEPAAIPFTLPPAVGGGGAAPAERIVAGATDVAELDALAGGKEFEKVGQMLDP